MHDLLPASHRRKMNRGSRAVASKTKNATRAATRQRATELRRQQQARERRRRILLTAGGAAAVLVVVVALGVGVAASRASRPSLAAVNSYTGLARTHVEGQVRYPQTPPVGGAHNQVWLNCGTYPSPVPNVNAVHSMEHGAGWITYRPDLPVAQAQRLRGDVSGMSYVVLSPYPGLPAPVVASAWGKQLQLADAADPRLKRFLATYRQGPQAPEPGASCAGGTGNPE